MRDDEDEMDDDASKVTKGASYELFKRAGRTLSAKYRESKRQKVFTKFQCFSQLK